MVQICKYKLSDKKTPMNNECHFSEKTLFSIHFVGGNWMLENKKKEKRETVTPSLCLLQQRRRRGGRGRGEGDELYTLL